MTDLASAADRLRALHHGQRPLVLPNVWDVASALLVVRAGFPVIATSSGAVAEALGFEDDDTMPADEAFAAVGRIANAVDLPVTADVEAGYQLPADELARRLIDAGAAGCNLEDTAHHGTPGLVDAEVHARRIADVKAAARASGVDLVLNARVDVFRGQRDDAEALLPEALRRALLYVEAGADSIYPITLDAPALIAAFVEAVPAPVNILLRGELTVGELAAMGVRRISLGSGLFDDAYAAVAERLLGLVSD